MRLVVVACGAWLVAPAASFALRAFTVRRAVELVALIPASQDATAEEIGTCETTMAWAFRLQPWLRNACLERSLAGFFLLRLGRRRCRLVVGAHRRAPDFAFHAWLEPVSTSARSREGYEPLMVWPEGLAS